MDEKLGDIVSVLTELLEDNTVPKNVKQKIDTIVKLLRDSSDISLNLNKAQNILDEISEDNNIQAYTRTQVWNIASMLESLNS